jgi:uncharacterized damage-inducible protein DinB
MPPLHELDTFRAVWNAEADRTTRVHEPLHHLIHHRGQLVMLCRMAGGSPPGLIGPNREEMVAMRERMEAVEA